MRPAAMMPPLASISITQTSRSMCTCSSGSGASILICRSASSSAITSAATSRRPHIFGDQTLSGFGVSLWKRDHSSAPISNKRLVEEDHDVPFLTVTTPALDELSAGFTFQRDVVDEPFEIFPGVVIPVGNYSYGLFQGHITTSAARPISVGFWLRLGDYYSGTRSDYRGEFNWRPSRFFTLNTAYEVREIQLREGDFEVNIASARVNLAFTPDLTWSTVVQYDNVSKQVGLNSRLRWTWRPGNDL